MNTLRNQTIVLCIATCSFLSLGCLRSFVSYAVKPEIARDLQLVAVPNEPEVFILKIHCLADSMRSPELRTTRKDDLLLLEVVMTLPGKNYIFPGMPISSFPFRIDQRINRISFGRENNVIWSRFSQVPKP